MPNGNSATKSVLSWNNHGRLVNSSDPGWSYKPSVKPHTPSRAFGSTQSKMGYVRVAQGSKLFYKVHYANGAWQPAKNQKWYTIKHGSFVEA